MNDQTSHSIRELMEVYYTEYYRDNLGLKDWRSRIDARLNEENSFGGVNLQRIQDWIDYDFKGKKVLVVGAGTGAELMHLHKMGADVYAIEPYDKAIEILHLKADQIGLSRDRIKMACAENIPYPEDEFDFVYCFTVLEHVQNVTESVLEMIRVTGEGKWLFIATPDYRQLYEPHYKMPMPMFLPKWILRLWLRWKKRPVEFLDTLQLVNTQQVARLLQRQNVLSMFMFHSWAPRWLESPTTNEKYIIWLSDWLGIPRDQWWLIKKLPNEKLRN